mmetsp:Transcript_20105/g.51288  ORF Transcript_20105/g.51288 Transcript_20105/m.51288 type:complete len:231 (-) Transcript_20105:29-721(-)
MGWGNVIKRALIGGAAVTAALHYKSLPFAYLIRHGVMIVREGAKPKLSSPFEPYVYTERVMPDDGDYNMHMNNSSYNKNADYGRFGLFLRMGVKQLRENKVYPANGAVVFHFVREIAILAKYKVITQVHSYGKKWFFVAHLFCDPHSNKVYAFGMCKFVFKSYDGKTVRPVDGFKMMGYEVEEDGSSAPCQMCDDSEYDVAGQSLLDHLDVMKKKLEEGELSVEVEDNAA